MRGQGIIKRAFVCSFESIFTLFDTMYYHIISCHVSTSFSSHLFHDIFCYHHNRHHTVITVCIMIVITS